MHRGNTASSIPRLLIILGLLSSLSLMAIVPAQGEVDLLMEGGSQPEVDDTPLTSNFTSYFDYNTMHVYLKELEDRYPSIMKLFSIGETYEGREILCVKLSDNVDTVDDGIPGSEPDALLVGAHHGNEWMSYEVPLYVLSYLLYYYGQEGPNGSAASYLIDSREIYVVPMLNADGVQYAHDESRGWRKNREPNYIGEFGPTARPNPDLYPVSYGTDINRNYGWMWHLDGGSNELITGAGTYRGPPDNYDDDGDALIQVDLITGRLPIGVDEGIDEDPWDGIDNDNDGQVDEDPAGGFTTHEARAMREFGDKYAFPVMITYHTYSELVLWPWGYTDELPPDSSHLSSLGVRMATMNGYRPMQGESLYPTTGEMTDWFYSQYGTYGYTFEIGRTHNMPDEEILEQVQRNLEPSLYLLDSAANRYRSYITFDENSTMVTSSSDWIDIDLSFEDAGYPYPFSEDRSRVVYRVNGGDWTWVPLEMIEDGNWTGRIPAQDDGSEIEYYFELVDSQGGSIVEPMYAPYDFHTISVPMRNLWVVYMVPGTIFVMIFTLGTIWGGFTFGIYRSLTSHRRGGP